jgi:hypothetical protein
VTVRALLVLLPLRQDVLLLLATPTSLMPTEMLPTDAKLDVRMLLVKHATSARTKTRALSPLISTRVSIMRVTPTRRAPTKLPQQKTALVAEPALATKGFRAMVSRVIATLKRTALVLTAHGQRVILQQVNN